MQETRLLQAIGRLQGKAQKETKAAAIEATLDRMAAPKAWSLSNGATAFVSTPDSMRCMIAAITRMHKPLPMRKPLDLLGYAQAETWGAGKLLDAPDAWQTRPAGPHTMSFGTTAKVLAERMSKYHRN